MATCDLTLPMPNKLSLKHKTGIILILLLINYGSKISRATEATLNSYYKKQNNKG
jgi:hypothetical protein